MLKETNATEDAPVETTLGANPEEVVDAEITRIIKEVCAIGFPMMVMTTRERRCDFGVRCWVL
jgi:hypothetical protein